MKLKTVDDKALKRSVDSGDKVVVSTYSDVHTYGYLESCTLNEKTQEIHSINLRLTNGKTKTFRVDELKNLYIVSRRFTTEL